MSDGDTPLLENLNVRTVRAKNDGVDEALTEKEEEIADLQKQIAEQEQKVETLEEEKETAKELLRQFRDQQKADHIERIQTANEIVDDDDEFDVSDLEKADTGVLETVADRMEKLAAAASESEGVSNTGNSPNLGNVDPNDLDDNPDDEMAQIADEMNMGGAYEKLQAGEFDSPEAIGASNEDNDPAKTLQDALEGVMEGGN